MPITWPLRHRAAIRPLSPTSAPSCPAGTPRLCRRPLPPRQRRAGVMWVTQAGAGAVHGLYFRVFGEKGGLEWFQETPNQLFHSRLGAPALVLRARRSRPQAGGATRQRDRHRPSRGLSGSLRRALCRGGGGDRGAEARQAADRLALDFPASSRRADAEVHRRGGRVVGNRRPGSTAVRKDDQKNNLEKCMVVMPSYAGILRHSKGR